MDIEEYTKTSLRNKKDKKETIEKLSKIIQHYKDITPQQAEKLSKTIYNEVNTTEQLNQDALGDLLQYPKTNIGMGEFGVGSRGQGDFYVHSKIAEIKKNTET